ncbi:hypothetical protein [Vibrio mexicanus]|uniref:hypothetical protein n=1 Tax=Vibrio mexicanus TaxID=1004326 RepID=UPI00063CD231|nr:hypothetical protein [Vibrio mexicanus]
MSSIYIDFISPQGHAKINELYFSELNSDDYYACKASYMKGVDCVARRLNFYSPWKGEPQGIKHAVEQLIFTMVFFVFKIKTILKVKNIVFLSYSPVWNYPLFLVLKGLLNKNICVLEHNSIPSATGTDGVKFNIKSRMFQLSSSLVTHLVYEDYIGVYLEQEFDAHYLVVKHPIIGLSKIESYDDKVTPLIFSPSSSSEKQVIDWLKDITINSDVITMVKSACNFEESGFVAKQYFENYEELMSSCDIIVIGSKFEERVSGVFYEALLAPKSILMLDSKFSRAAVKCYPNVHVFDSCEQLKELILKVIGQGKPSLKIYNVDNHNLQSSISRVIK